MRCALCGAVAGDCGLCPEHFLGTIAATIYNAFDMDFNAAMDALTRYCIWNNDPVSFHAALYAIVS